MAKGFYSDRVFVARLGSSAAIASNGAPARLADVAFVAPGKMRVLSVWRHNLAANEVTAGTAVSSASYRRHTLVDGGSDGTGTRILASLDAKTSAASFGKREFAVVSTPTVAAGAILYGSHTTQGANSADATDAAAGIWSMAYQLL